MGPGPVRKKLHLTVYEQKLTIVRLEELSERIYDVTSTHTPSMREYVLIHIIYSLHLYNEVIHTHT
jgi:hypothetical protein